MTVREFLACHTSADLAELRAYEVVNGPIGQVYEREAFAALHDQMQRVCSILIAVNSKDPEDAPDVLRYPRSHEVYTFDDQEE